MKPYSGTNVKGRKIASDRGMNMLKSMVVMASAVICAVLAGMGALSLGEHRTAASAADVEASAAVASPEISTAPVDAHATAIPKASDGHFWANATVNQKAVRFLVDTGATVVVLTPADAQRLGFDRQVLIYDRKVVTANGPTEAAQVVLSTVGIGGSTVHNVEALVLRDGLNTSLLGMSYLGRLRRFEATPSSLILHP